MRKSGQFDNILNECLERLLVKGESIEQCLASYPEQAAELKPLLEMALATKRASAIQPRSEFKTRARYQFRAALQEARTNRGHRFFSWQSGWATAAIVVLVLLLAGSGTVVAASNTMPDEPLYQVKLATEQVQLGLTFSPLSKAELCAKLADKRVHEIVYLANKGKPKQVELATQRLNTYLTMIAKVASTQREKGGTLTIPTPMPSKESKDGNGARVQANKGRAKLRMTIARYAINHPAALRQALKTAPESAKPALRWAIAVSVAGYEKAVKALD